VSTAVEKPTTKALQLKKLRKNTRKNDGVKKVAAFTAGQIQPYVKTLLGMDRRRIPCARERISIIVEEKGNQSY
jgi:hypothetical protein